MNNLENDKIPNPPSRQLLNVKDVASRLQLSERSVHRLITKGELKAIHIGRSLRITEKALQTLLTGAESP